MKTQFLTIPITCLALTTASQAVNVFTGTGADTAGLQGTVDSFRSALGNGSTTPNTPNGTNNSDGFRAIDWDAAPDAVSDPNGFPGGFFNTDFFPRARGMSFTTDGSGFSLSSTAASGVSPRFGTFNAAYGSEFTTFSPERLFSPVGSNIVDVFFFDPANPTQPALVDGFGAVFVDVDTANLSNIEYYDINDNLITSIDALALDGGLSFVGAHFDTEGEILARVRINLGDGILGDDDDINDVVVLDDFIVGEPVAIPEPSTSLLLSACGLFALTVRRRK